MTQNEVISSGVIASSMTFLVGGITENIKVLIVFFTVNFILGALVGIKNKELCSERALDGIFKFIAIFSILILLHHFTKLSSATDDIEALKTATLYFFMAYYATSILENAVLIGVPMPEQLKKVLKVLKEKNNLK